MTDGEPGEVWVSGPSTMNQYLGNKEATESIIANSWLRTGDIAYCSQGKWYIVGRSKVRYTPACSFKPNLMNLGYD